MAAVTTHGMFEVWVQLFGIAKHHTSIVTFGLHQSQRRSPILTSELQITPLERDFRSYYNHSQYFEVCIIYKQNIYFTHFSAFNP